MANPQSQIPLPPEQTDPSLQLDHLLQVVNPKIWMAFAGLLGLLLILFLWGFFGTIPIKANGNGILMTHEGFFSVQSQKEGIVHKILISKGLSFNADEQLLSVGEDPVVSSEAGKVIDIKVDEGEFVKPGQPLILAEHSGSNDLILRAYFSVEQGQEIKSGQQAKIELIPINPQEQGVLLGTVEEVVSYSTSRDKVQHEIVSEGIVQFLLGGNQVAVEVIIRLQPNPENPSGYAWSFGKGPDFVLTSGMIGKVTVITSEMKPITWVFPAWRS